MPQFVPYALIACVWLMERETMTVVLDDVTCPECPGGGGVMVTV